LINCVYIKVFKYTHKHKYVKIIKTFNTPAVLCPENSRCWGKMFLSHIFITWYSWEISHDCCFCFQI